MQMFAIKDIQSNKAIYVACNQKHGYSGHGLSLGRQLDFVDTSWYGKYANVIFVNAM